MGWNTKMSKPITDKILGAYFHVAESMNGDEYMTSSKHYFHRTKKYAFSVMAERLDEDGYLPGEKEYVDKN